MYAVFLDGQQIWEPSANRQKLMAWIMRTGVARAGHKRYQIRTIVSAAARGQDTAVSQPALPESQCPDPASAAVPCPFPWTGDDGTSRQCIAREHCGCDEGSKADDHDDKPAESADRHITTQPDDLDTFSRPLRQGT